MKILILTLFILIGIFLGTKLQNIAPTMYEGRTYAITVKPTPTPTPKTSQIVAEIARVFENEPKHVMVKAINCFYSESGLRHDALNTKNKNGTTDGGVAQINSIWRMSEDDRMDYKKNIAKAYEIYKRRNNFSAWYGKLCGE